MLIYNLINYFCSRFYRFIFITIMAVVQSGEEKKSQDFADIIIQKSPLWEIGVLPCGAVEVDQKELKSRRLNSPLVQVFLFIMLSFVLLEVNVVSLLVLFSVVSSRQVLKK